MVSPFWRVEKLDVTGSTNDDIRNAWENGASEGLVITAKCQNSGRGRHERVWNSPDGNLYCSALLKPNTMPRDAGLHSFIAALAVHDAVKDALPKAGITLKWPNDVLVDGKKISGILLEVAGDALIIGVGINVEHHPADTPYPATSLAKEGAPNLELTPLLEKYLERLKYWYNIMQKSGFEPIRTAWLAYAQKGALTVRLPHENLQGSFANINENGHLQLILADGAQRAISTGDVFFPPKD